MLKRIAEFLGKRRVRHLRVPVASDSAVVEQFKKLAQLRQTLILSVR